MGPDELGRRGGGGRPQNDLQAFGCQGFNCLIQPFPLEMIFGWFHFSPGKFADPDNRKARLKHQTGIYRPALDRPVFRIITDSKSQGCLPIICQILG